MNLLMRDTNANKTVNASDLGQAKAESGLPITVTNFRDDVTINGSINGSDVSLVKARAGASVP